MGIVFSYTLTIATRLTQNQQFEEARKWLHYIFNPTITGTSEEGAERFWITKPFRNEIRNNIVTIEELLLDEAYADELAIQLDYWEHNPFNPHAVARFRVQPICVKQCCCTLITLLNGATSYLQEIPLKASMKQRFYTCLPQNILGQKPQDVPASAKPVEKSFYNIKEELDRFSNVKAILNY